jgi:hypothetical protein
MIKYTDDLAILGQCLKDHTGTSTYNEVINQLISSVQGLQLILNTSKIKALISCLKAHPNSELLTLSGSDIERVSQFKYLGTIITEDMNFDVNFTSRLSKAKRNIHYEEVKVRWRR